MCEDRKKKVGGGRRKKERKKTCLWLWWNMLAPVCPFSCGSFNLKYGHFGKKDLPEDNHSKSLKHQKPRMIFLF